MRNSGRCPKCGDTRIAGPHRVHGGEGWVKIDLPGFSTATLDSYTCGNCGYSEFYADQMGLNNIRSSGRFLQRTERQSQPTRCPSCLTPLNPGALYCPECGHRWHATFDIVSFFWSEIDAWAYRTLHQVHRLASAYGWREADILAMSPWRRQFYLSLQNGSRLS